MDNREIKAMMAELAPVIREYAEKAIAPLQVEIAELRKELAARPEPQDGKSVDVAEVEAMVTAAISAIPTAQDGKDADPAETAKLVKEEVARAVAAIPKPQDGKSVTAEEIAPLVSNEVAKAVGAIPAPKDGVGMAGAMIDREGGLVVTLTNGEVKHLGRIVGDDGDPGLDGLGFEDMTEELADDGRTIIRRYTRGDQAKEFRHSISVVLDRGVFKDGLTYAPGDGVTWAGSFWIAQKETAAKPDGGDGWRLAVKRGRDGKDGVLKAAGSPQPVRVS
jgi:hypothetical protein